MPPEHADPDPGIPSILNDVRFREQLVEENDSMSRVEGKHSDLVLVSMPWAPVHLTPIQLGILQHVVEREGFRCCSRSFFLAAAAWFDDQTKNLAPEERLTLADYLDIASNHWRKGLGDWIFAVPPYRENTSESDERYLAFLKQRQVPDTVIRKSLLMRSVVPSLLEKLAAEVRALHPRAVGFSSVFAQNIPSLVLAKILKEHTPDLQIIFGGSNCDGPMGEVLLRSFPWVDLVIRGEGETVLPEVLRDLCEGHPIRSQPGLCFRKDGTLVITESRPSLLTLDKVPEPNYDEYFSRLKTSSIYPKMAHEVRVLFESARGCWWGEKNPCNFCGLNGTSMSFRSKPPEQTAGELVRLASRYRQTRFEAVDNIMDNAYLSDFLPVLRRYRHSGFDVDVFYEIKSNLRKSQVRLLRQGGVRTIQPGIESLSTPILRLMRKGVTAIQNIALLKWARQYGITLYWTILYGVPGESLDEYVRMADVCRSLTHLEPPSLAQIVIERFSPYHQSPEAFGITGIKPARWYEYVYDLTADELRQLAHDFDHQFVSGYDPAKAREIMAPVLDHWRESFKANKSSLTYRRGPGFMIINDRRSNLGARRIVLDKVQSQVYLACDAGSTPEQVAAKLKDDQPDAHLSPAEVQTILDDQANARLFYIEGRRYLSLAIPEGEEDLDGE